MGQCNEMKCFFLLRFAHFSKFSMYTWGKSKSVSFSRVYVCVKAKLTLVKFFLLFFLCTFPLRTLAIAWTVEYHLLGGMDRRATLPSGRQTLRTPCTCDWWFFYSKVREDMFSMPRINIKDALRDADMQNRAVSEIISMLLFRCY